MSMITSKKWLIKITLLINREFKRELIALVDSGADLNCVQEELIPTKYFGKTVHSLRNASGEKMEINYKLSNALICKNKVCILTSFVLVKNMTNQLILGTPFVQKIFPIKEISEKGIIGTFQNKQIMFEFIHDPVTRVFNQMSEILRAKNHQLNFLKEEINAFTIQEKLKNPKL